MEVGPTTPPWADTPWQTRPLRPGTPPQDQVHPPWADTPLGQTPPWAHPQAHTPLGRHAPGTKYIPRTKYAPQD